jgi:foldase protein PrsA
MDQKENNVPAADQSSSVSKGEENFEPALPKKGFSVQSVIMIVLGMVVAIIALLAVAIYGFKREDQPLKVAASALPFPMALVQNQFISMADYWTELGVVLKACQQVGTDCKITDKDRQDVKDSLVREKIVLLASKEMDLSVPQADLDKEYNQIVSDNGGQEKFLEVLNKQFGWSVDTFKEKVKINMLTKQLQSKIIKQVRASHILVAVDANADQAKIDEAKQKAMDIKKRLDNGEDFATLAEQLSDDPSAKSNKGDLGFFAKGTMVAEFEQAAFNMSVGQVSDPVKTQYGWHIIKVTDVSGQQDISLKDWLDQQKSKYHVWLLI